MSNNSLLPLNDTDFWWLRYFCGLFLPLLLLAASAASFITQHSYAIWAGSRSFRLVPVSGEQALWMGLAYAGMSLALFAQCYAQYHDKMGFYYQWLLAGGVLLTGAGLFKCSWIFLGP